MLTVYVYLEFAEDDELVDLEQNDLDNCHQQQLCGTHLPQHGTERYENGRRGKLSSYDTGNNSMENTSMKHISFLRQLADFGTALCLWYIFILINIYKVDQNEATFSGISSKLHKIIIRFLAHTKASV